MIFILVLDSVPTHALLLKTVVPLYASHWKTIGLLLGIRSLDLRIIELGASDEESCLHVLLLQWLGNNPYVTWKTIIAVVDRIEDAHGKIFLCIFACVYVHMHTNSNNAKAH